jgi:uncharacterized membrane protein (Fun14 family)
MHFPGRLNAAIITISAILIADCLLAQEVTASATVATGAALLDNLPPEVRFAAFNLGSGGIAGWAVGFTLKKFAKLAALVVGTVFMAIQYLAYKRYITIDWERIRESVPDEAIEQSYSELMSVLTFNLPFAGAFVVGFWLGFRKG